MLTIKPSSRSKDYVRNKKQFQLHTLLTEQRHPRTWNLSFVIKDDVKTGLEQIFSVDEDIAVKFSRMAQDTTVLDQAARAVCRALQRKQKIFIYGCGATGRLAKQMESALWRPFWKKIKTGSLREKLKSALFEGIEDRLIGEMTGGDRALISSLEGFEDLLLVGELQLKDRGIKKGDAVFCITEGGETSSVIGVILAAAGQYGNLTEAAIREAGEHLYFIYNNPDDLLTPFDRSLNVLNHPAITRINLTTGPQAITGSTRMQATTSETYVMGLILEQGIFRFLKEFLTREDLSSLGFDGEEWIKKGLQSFKDIREALAASIEDIAKFTALESRTYENNMFSTYFAKKALITVFVDCTERSPTFHLYPLDTTQRKNRKCWLQVWTEAEDYKKAWRNFLGRDFRGLEESIYKPHFLDSIDDAYLKEAALSSLSVAGKDQEKLYDFSFSVGNIHQRGPKEGDLGVIVCMDEEIDALADPDSSFSRFVNLCKERKSSIALVLISDKDSHEVNEILQSLPLDTLSDVVLNITVDKAGDPLNLKRQTILKILLNGHSTGVMAKIGRVVGNTMTSVYPTNLKLIGRATYLIQTHVNDVISKEEWENKLGKTEKLSYAEANSALFEAMDFTHKKGEQTSEVELSIIAILEAIKTKNPIDWEKAFSLLQSTGIENYLLQQNPDLVPKGVD